MQELFNQQPLFVTKPLMGEPISKPINDVVDGCVFDCDATIYSSFNGDSDSPLEFYNIVENPRDGSSIEQYDFNALTTARPTFAGKVNSPDAYFQFDGNDRFIGIKTLSTFLNNLHKTTGGADFAFTMALYYVSGNQIFFSNREAGGANIGVMLYTLSAQNTLQFLQRGNTGNSSVAASSEEITPNAWNFFGVSHSHSTNTTRIWLNSDISEEFSITFNTTTASASATNLGLGAYGGGQLPLANGSRLKGVQGFNKFMDDDEMREVLVTLNNRYSGIFDDYLSTA